jgi:hypothetical protein
MKNIARIATAKFKLSTPGVLNSELELDFNPIISEFKLIGNFTLIHWQARPKGYRQWGVYRSLDDSYRCVDELTINLSSAKSLQLNDATATTVPSAVFYTSEDRINCINDKLIIGNVFVADLT